MQNTLESHRFFPAIAWILIAGLAGFTYLITMHVRAELSDIGNNVERVEIELGDIQTGKTGRGSARVQ